MQHGKNLATIGIPRVHTWLARTTSSLIFRLITPVHRHSSKPLLFNVVLRHLHASKRPCPQRPVISVIAKASVLSKVVRAGEPVATAIASERPIASVERAIVTLEVFLATEAAVALITDESLGWVFGEGLLAAAAIDRSSVRSVSRIGAHHAVGRMVLRRSRLAVGN